MSRKTIPEHQRRCVAMIRAGVEDPESQAGIEFCINSCPYDFCVVMEHLKIGRSLMRKEKIDIAKELREHGISIEDIALILGVTRRNVQRYLKK